MRTVVKLMPQNHDYGEEFTYGFTFSSLSPKRLVAQHAPVNCKDFLTDVWWSEYTGRPSGKIYGFSWNPGTLPVTDPVRRIALCYTGDITSYKDGLGKLLREFDVAQGASPSEIRVANKGAVLIVSFDPFWTSRPYLISAYTSLMRMGFGYADEGVAKYLKQNKFLCEIDRSRSYHITPRLLAMLNGRAWPQTYHQFPTAYLAHNGGGILSWTGFA